MRSSAMLTGGRIALAVGAIVIVDAFAGAQPDDWIRQSPYPVGVSLRCATWVDSQHGYAVGDDQAFVQTRDGGDTWEQVTEVVRDPSFSQDPFNNIFFLDDQHGWIVGNNNEAWRTTDGGATWTQMTNHPAGSYYHLEFVTPELGWTGGNGSICRSSDGGRTWMPVFYYDEYGVVYGMDFLDSTFGAMCSDPVVFGAPVEGVYLTDDAGDSWTLAREGIHNDVALFSRNLIIAAEPGRIIRSTDGGDSWVTVYTDNEEGFGELVIVDADTVAASGFSGSVWISDDRGLSWEKTLEGVGRLPAAWGISFTDSSLGALAGPFGWLFRTDDGGHTWRSFNRGLATGWDDIEMYDRSRGYVVSASGYFARTDDGGEHWTPGRLEVTGPLFGRDEGLNVVSVVDEDCVVAAGDGGVVFKSIDGGLTWESIGYPELPEFWINGVDFVSRDVGWVLGQSEGLDALLYKTTNGGQSWFRQGQGQMHAIYDCQFFDENEGWVAGGDSLIWKTEDGGVTWIPYEFPYTFSTPAFEIEFDTTNRDVGWLLQATDEVKRTEDGGIIWARLPVPGLEDREWPLDISLVDESHAWIVTNFGKAFETTDAGQTWDRVHTGHMDRYVAHLGGVHATPDNHVWVTGGDFQTSGLILANLPPDQGGIELSQTPMRRGEIATMTVSNAAPNETVYFLYSRAGIGIGPSIPQLGGLRLDLLNPVEQLGSSAADGEGIAQLSRRVPGNAPLIDIHTQAVIRRGASGADSVKSNTVSDQIQP